MVWVSMLAAGLLGAWLTSLPAQAADCGVVQLSPEDSIPITNCDNPFGASPEFPFAHSLTLADQLIMTDAVLELATTSNIVGSFTLEAPGNFEQTPLVLYRKIDAGYELVQSISRDFFIIPELRAGEYVAVFLYDQIFLMHTPPSWWQRVRTLFTIPTAYAIHSTVVAATTISFTVVITAEPPEELEPEPEPEPRGASSVLFLPGIQASRLYAGETISVPGFFNDVRAGERVWEPGNNNDVRALSMNEAGNSVNTIYTKEVLDSVIGLNNIYKSLLDDLETLRSSEQIQSYNAFAYDWRHDVFSVATQPIAYGADEYRRLVDVVQTLAADSYTGKVTIVAHSNGGLVAKALLHAYGQGELAGLVDKLILVGVPQLGTPKTIGVLLHGLDQSALWGLVISQSTARDVLRNLPGAYTLLPSMGYFAATENTPVVTAIDAPATSYVADYGDMASVNTLDAFMLDDFDLRPGSNSLHEPSVLNETLLTRARAQQQILDEWQAPDGVAVYEVVGTGLGTIAGFEYREFRCQVNILCAIQPTSKPVPIMTSAGDKTVMAVSAQGYQGDKIVAVVDLFREGDRFLTFTKEHGNMTESTTIRSFLKSVILYPYIHDAIVVPSEFATVSNQYTLIGVHSPVSLSVELANGEVFERPQSVPLVSQVGGQYFELAGSKYIVVPTGLPFDVTLAGEATGGYSLTIDSFDGDAMQPVHELIGLPISTSSIVRFSYTDGTYSPLAVDINGDGVADEMVDWDGKVTNLTPEPSTSTLEEVDSAAEVLTPAATRIGTRVRISESEDPLPVVAGVMSQSSDLENYNRQLYMLLIQLMELLLKMEEKL